MNLLFGLLAVIVIFLSGFVCGAATIIAVALNHSKSEDEAGRE